MLTCVWARGGYCVRWEGGSNMIRRRRLHLQTAFHCQLRHHHLQQHRCFLDLRHHLKTGILNITFKKMLLVSSQPFSVYNKPEQWTKHRLSHSCNVCWLSLAFGRPVATLMMILWHLSPLEAFGSPFCQYLDVIAGSNELRCHWQNILDLLIRQLLQLITFLVWLIDETPNVSPTKIPSKNF